MGKWRHNSTHFKSVLDRGSWSASLPKERVCLTHEFGLEPGLGNFSPAHVGNGMQRKWMSRKMEIAYARERLNKRRLLHAVSICAYCYSRQLDACLNCSIVRRIREIRCGRLARVSVAVIVRCDTHSSQKNTFQCQL